MTNVLRQDSNPGPCECQAATIPMWPQPLYLSDHFNHLNDELVSYSDPHFILYFYTEGQKQISSFLKGELLKVMASHRGNLFKPISKNYDIFERQIIKNWKRHYSMSVSILRRFFSFILENLNQHFIEKLKITHLPPFLEEILYY